SSEYRSPRPVLLRIRVPRRREVAVADVLEDRDRADEAEERVDQGEIEKIRPPRQKADHGDQEHRRRSEDVHRESPVVDRRPLEAARDGHPHPHENRDRTDEKHHDAGTPFSIAAILAFISPSSIPSIASQATACTWKSLPVIATVTVPGVSVIELARMKRPRSVRGFPRNRTSAGEIGSFGFRTTRAMNRFDFTTSRTKNGM